MWNWINKLKFWKKDPIVEGSNGKQEIDFLELATNTIVENGITSESLKYIEKLLDLQRTHEDTKARRRLEQWTKWVISVYLIVVFALVFLNAIAYNCSWFGRKFEISDFSLTTILSSTTVTVIGLVIIVLKGHFPQKKQNEKQEQQNEQ